MVHWILPTRKDNNILKKYLSNSYIAIAVALLNIIPRNNVLPVVINGVLHLNFPSQYLLDNIKQTVFITMILISIQCCIGSTTP